MASAAPEPMPEPMPEALPIGRSGRLEAIALAAGEDAAVLVRERDADGRARALLTTDKLAAGERLVVMPLDEEVEVRVDGDALAVWLGSGTLSEGPNASRATRTEVPTWATLVGGALLAIVVAMALIGSAVAFGWVVRLFG